MLGFGSSRSWRLVAGVMLLGVVGAIVAFRPSSGPRPSGASSTHSATTRSSTVPRPPPNSFQTAHPRTSTGGGADRIEGPYGRSGREVWVVVPDRPVRSVVVFGHGWKLTPPSPAHSWVGQFRPWLDHLAADGSAVIFPRYQLGIGDTQDATRVLDFAHGLHTGYALLGRPKVPIVAVGYSFGASLAFYYGANAAAWRLPLPSAVQAVFPAGMIPGAPLPALNPTVRVLIQVGDADTEAGSAGANAFWSWLATHPSSRKRYQVIRSSPGLAATHAAPKSPNAAAQRTFWAPLDRLIAQARTARSSGAPVGTP
jgi:dienelactone hydrolase